LESEGDFISKLKLVKPHNKYLEEIWSYRQEFIDNDSKLNGVSGLSEFEDISMWIEQCCLMENKETLPVPEWVEADQFMLVQEDNRYILGMINFRHYLNEYLSEYGGHIGYSVRPSERRKGYAKAMLELCLEKCREYGLEKVLITCDKDNEPSRRTILACGGVFERDIIDADNELERYWIILRKKNRAEIIFHYDTIIDEINNPLMHNVTDPAHDFEPLKSYMDKWDGEAFIEALKLSKDKSVLEIGVGTGRLALRVCGQCGSFLGIDVSPKTIERAKDNLRSFQNVSLICSDFLTYRFEKTFDVIYSSLTFMHIEDKKHAIQKVFNLLTAGGRFVLSIEKGNQIEINYGTRLIKVFPDTPKEIATLITETGLNIEKQFETEFAVIFTAVKELKNEQQRN